MEKGEATGGGIGHEDQTDLNYTLSSDDGTARLKAILVSQGFSSVVVKGRYCIRFPVARVSSMHAVFTLVTKHEFEPEGLVVEENLINSFHPIGVHQHDPSICQTPAKMVLR